MPYYSVKEVCTLLGQMFWVFFVWEKLCAHSIVCLCARSVLFECRGRFFVFFVDVLPLLFFFVFKWLHCVSSCFFPGVCTPGGGALHSIATALTLLYTVSIVSILYQSCLFASPTFGTHTHTHTIWARQLHQHAWVFEDTARSVFIARHSVNLMTVGDRKWLLRLSQRKVLALSCVL